VLPALNNAVPAPPLEARQPGGQASANGSAVDLSTALGHPEIVTGNLSPAALTADLTNGAHSAVDVSLANLSLAGGLVSAASVSSKLGTAAAGDASSATRTVKIGAVSVLDLGALLNGLGLSLADLPVQSVSDLLDTLSATVPGGLVPDGSTVAEVQSTLDTAITDVQNAISAGDGANPVGSTLSATLDGLLSPLGVTAPTATDTLNAALDAVRGVLDNLLTGSLSALDNLSLLKLDGADVTISTKAVEKLADSAATVTASVGGISLGGVTVPGVNLLTTAQDLSNTLNAVNGIIGQALSSVDPGLASLVKISMFDPITKTVTADNGYNRSRAGITVLTANVTPPAILGDIVRTVQGQAGIGDAITTAGGTVPTLASAMNTLNTTLDQGVSALSQGAAVTVGSVLSASDYAVPVGGTGPTHPATGGTPTLAILGLVFALLAIGMRRWMASPAVRD
jgi:hypothetical protein